MNYLKVFVSSLFISLFMICCDSSDKFLIEKGKVGELTKSATVEEIKVLFEKDSIVEKQELPSESKISTFTRKNDNEIDVYSKGGQKLLHIVTSKNNDSITEVNYVEILSKEFKTSKGITIQSLFKDVNLNYTINKIETSLSSATLYIDELGVTLTIDKEDIGPKAFALRDVTVGQIPASAKVKSMTVWFD